MNITSENASRRVSIANLTQETLLAYT